VLSMAQFPTQLSQAPRNHLTTVPKTQIPSKLHPAVLPNNPSKGNTRRNTVALEPQHTPPSAAGAASQPIGDQQPTWLLESAVIPVYSEASLLRSPNPSPSSTAGH
jgi:hypothetical protein